ncbi:MAG: preprotein translocase subunit YajC, partial [Pseudonocardiaceae bacterium]
LASPAALFAGPSHDMEALVPLLITFGLMWLLLIRPQQRRVRSHQAVLRALAVGDEVITAGGIHATVVAVEDELLHVEVAPGVVLRLLKGAVSQRISGGDEFTEDELTDDELTDDELTDDELTDDEFTDDEFTDDEPDDVDDEGGPIDSQGR